MQFPKSVKKGSGKTFAVKIVYFLTGRDKRKREKVRLPIGKSNFKFLVSYNFAYC